MRSDYSSALRDLLEEVVETSTPQAAETPAVYKHFWRELVITATVAAAIITPTSIILSNGMVAGRFEMPATSGESHSVAPTDTTSAPPGSLVFLGLVQWTRPAATSTRTSTIYITENWEPLYTLPGTCGITTARTTVSVSADGSVTITVRGYGHPSTSATLCSETRVSPSRTAVALPAVTNVRAVTDAATHVTSPLEITSRPAANEVVHDTPAP